MEFYGQFEFLHCVEQRIYIFNVYISVLNNWLRPLNPLQHATVIVEKEELEKKKPNNTSLLLFHGSSSGRHALFLLLSLVNCAELAMLLIAKGN